MMGGYIADAIGLHRTFLVVGCIFAVVVVAANTLLSETRRGGGAPPKQPGKGGRPGLQSLASFSSVMRCAHTLAPCPDALLRRSAASMPPNL